MSDYKISETEAAIKALRKTGYDPVIKLRGNKYQKKQKKNKK